MKYLLTLLLFANSALAQTVIVIPSNQQFQPYQQPYNNQAAQMAEGWNWNVRRNAAIADALTYEQLRPPVQVQIQKVEPVQPYIYKMPEADSPSESGQYEIIE